MNIQLNQAHCPHCRGLLEENEQSQLACTRCYRVQESIAFSQGVTFANQKMDGQVVDVNGTLLFNLEKYNRRASEKRLARAKTQMQLLRSLIKIDKDDEEAYYLILCRLIPAMRIIRYADSLGFFDKGKTIEPYAAAAFYIALRWIKVPNFLFRNLTCSLTLAIK